MHCNIYNKINLTDTTYTRDRAKDKIIAYINCYKFEQLGATIEQTAHPTLANAPNNDVRQ